MNDLPGPAYLIETARLRMRCFTPADTPVLSRAIEENLTHLRPWLTWTAHEPLSFDERLTWIRTQRGHFDLGSDYCYGAFNKDESQLCGVGVLRMAASVDEREVGYWIHRDQLRRGLAHEMVSALIRVAFEIEAIDTLEARTFPHNLASAGLVTKLGFSGPVVDPLSYPLPTGDKVDLHVYSLSRVEYAASPARELPFQAFDALSRRIR